jgi:hypothetical protein
MSPEVVNKLKIIEDCGRNPQMKLATGLSPFAMYQGNGGLVPDAGMAKSDTSGFDYPVFDV